MQYNMQIPEKYKWQAGTHGSAWKYCCSLIGAAPTPYYKAGKALMDHNYDKALENALFAKKNGGDLVSPNATLVAAQILTEQKKFDEAVKELDSVKSEAYEIEKQELLGDIYFAKKDLDKAHDAYKKALDVSESKKISISPLLQMKIGRAHV